MALAVCLSIAQLLVIAATHLPGFERQKKAVLILILLRNTLCPFSELRSKLVWEQIVSAFCAQTEPLVDIRIAMENLQYRSEVTVDNRTKSLVERSSNVVLATHVEPKDDMIIERNRASFDTKGLAEYLNGGKEKLQRLYAPNSPRICCPLY